VSVRVTVSSAYDQPSADGEIGWMEPVDITVGRECGNIGSAPIDFLWVSRKQWTEPLLDDVDSHSVAMSQSFAAGLRHQTVGDPRLDALPICGDRDRSPCQR
jgi:hypothetical protein